MDDEMDIDWFQVSNPDVVDSPGLVVDIDRVTENIAKMVAMVDGDADRLRPHVKTHKMPTIVQLQMDAGIKRFKTATLAETEMVAEAGGADILLAHQVVGPKVDRLKKLVGRYPDTSFATIVDDIVVVETIASKFDAAKPIRLFVDIDCGMKRTGIKLGSKCEALIRSIESHDAVQFAGLHVYDGHLHQPSLEERQAAAGDIIIAVRKYAQQYPDAEIVGGGSPTFGMWAGQTDWQCSPGTPVFWDVGYATAYSELEFKIAAAMLTRVISKPGKGQLCFDLGYKSVSSEMDLEHRVTFPEIPDAKLVAHSEEHLVVWTEMADQISVGQAFLAFPRHICPTVANHAFATVVRWGNATREALWVTARDR